MNQLCKIMFWLLRKHRIQASNSINQGIGEDVIPSPITIKKYCVNNAFESSRACPVLVTQGLLPHRHMLVLSHVAHIKLPHVEMMTKYGIFLFPMGWIIKATPLNFSHVSAHPNPAARNMDSTLMYFRAPSFLFMAFLSHELSLATLPNWAYID
jgi:hypothetical protein